MRRRSLGLPQQCYADDGMWMDTHAQQQQQSYAFHEESWSSDNNNNSYHKQQFPAGMYMKKPGANKLGATYGMFQENMPNGHHHGHDGGKKLGGNIIINSSHHHQFPNGGAKFNSGGHNGYSSDSDDSCEEYEEYSEEMHHGAGKVMKMDENLMRYERHNWGGDHAYYVNPYDHMHGRKPHGGHKWTSKGV